MIIEFELNGKLHQAHTSPGTSLLEYLRSQQLFSVKHGCDHGECGACTILRNDKAVNAWLILMHSIEGDRIETLESFSTHKEMHDLQDSFLSEGAAQCGFCTPGMIASIEALNREKTELSEDHIRNALNGNLCRCTGYVKPVAAALKSLTRLKTDGVSS